jgi:hypothetical protein
MAAGGGGKPVEYRSGGRGGAICAAASLCAAARLPGVCYATMHVRAPPGETGRETVTSN